MQTRQIIYYNRVCLWVKNGTEFDTSDGLPYGTFSNLTVGTKVIVAKANNGTRGIVLAKYPWADEAGSILAAAASNS